METKRIFNPVIIVRTLQATLAIITLGLFGSVASWYNSNAVPTTNTTPTTNVPSSIAYAIFIPVLTILLTLPYVILAPRYFPSIANRHAILLIELTTQILWFASWIASAAFLGHLSVCRGSVCTAAKLGVVVAAFEWVTFAVTTVFAVRYCLWFSEVNRVTARGEEGGSEGKEPETGNGDAEEGRLRRTIERVMGWNVTRDDSEGGREMRRVVEIKHPGQF